MKMARVRRLKLLKHIKLDTVDNTDGVVTAKFKDTFDWCKKYPDSEKGAIEALGEMSNHDMDGATASCTDCAEGVWLVTHKDCRSLVYLTGYGLNGLENDFEDED